MYYTGTGNPDVRSVAYSSDGEHILTGIDSGIRYWKSDPRHLVKAICDEMTIEDGFERDLRERINEIEVRSLNVFDTRYATCPNRSALP